MYDLIIIGAGISGSMLAYELSRYQLKVLVVDKNNDIADGATMANSAIIHTGYDPEDGTLKAKLNVEGARMYPQILKDLHCKNKVIGAYIAAVGEEEEAGLEVLRQRAEKRNIPYEILSGDEARKEEPNLSDSVTKVLSFPTTTIVYPWEIAIACMQVAVRNGAELRLNTKVSNIDQTTDGFLVHADNDTFETKYIVNAAGVDADTIYGCVSKQPSFTMRPRRGEYFVLDQTTNFCHHVIFPVPSAKGKGVLAVPTVYGNILLGPNSDYIAGTEDNGSSFQGLEYVRANINKTMKNVPFNHSIRTFAGLRPSSSSSDFIIEEAPDVPHFINCASIESPGLASAPAIAKYIIEKILAKDMELKEKENYDLTREAPVVLSECTPEERNEYIKKNPAYGRIVCRCEQVSEGEIVDCIHAVCGARTVKAVKKRVRPGMGRCQGGFCEPRVVGILARELGISPLDVVLDGEKSKILESENR